MKKIQNNRFWTSNKYIIREFKKKLILIIRKYSIHSCTKTDFDKIQLKRLCSFVKV